MRSISTLLVTGGAGFIGSNFIRHYLGTHSNVRVTNFDKLTYAGNLENLADVESDPQYNFVQGDIADRECVADLFQRVNPDAIVNFAAESHVDRSVLGAMPFVQTNVAGTLVLLEAAREHWHGQEEAHCLVQVSTDEVYGDLGSAGRFTEQNPLAPNNPYSASKASADLLCRAYHRTHGFPVIVTRCSNNYGPCQFPEKLIPVMIDKASRGEKLPVYGDGTNVRDWIHVLDHCRAIDTVLARGNTGEVYNIGADMELTNLELVRLILQHLERGENLIELVRDRPGHDRRYAIDSSKLRAELGWEPTIQFEDGLAVTIEWYQSHGEWVGRCKSGEYRNYYEANYATRLEPSSVNPGGSPGTVACRGDAERN